MLSLPFRGRWAVLVLGFAALSFLSLHWYLGISNVFSLPAVPLTPDELAESEVGGQTEINDVAKTTPTPKLPPLTKNTIVMARLKDEDVSWVANELPGYIYQSPPTNPQP